MTPPRIDPEFAAIVPPLSDEERAGLEADIVRDGVTVPMVVWGELLLDGHNRLAICRKHGLPYPPPKSAPAWVDCREQAIVWICDNQTNRRNLPDIDRIGLYDHKAAALARLAKANQRAGNAAGGKLAGRGRPIGRGQICPKPITIRMSRASGAETEWEKRLRALDEIERCWLLPFLTVQAYVDEPSLLNGVGVVRTVDLFATVRKEWDCGGARGWLRRNARGDGDAEFLAVDWAWLRRQGIKIQYKGSP